MQVASTHKKYLCAKSKTSTCKDKQLEILGFFNIDVYHDSVCVNHNLVKRFRNAYCIKRMILIRMVTPLISEAIKVVMHTLSYTIKASMHTCFAFNSLIGVQFFMFNSFTGG